VLSLLGFFAAAGIPGRFDVPLHYVGGDTLSNLAGVKTILDTGGWFHNPFIGAPAGADLADLPNCDLLHLAALKLLCLITGNWAVATNLFYLAGYPLAAVTALCVLRRLGISRPVAITIAVLFALAPYHFFQNQEHLMLSAYFMLPLAILVALQLMQSDDIPRRRLIRCAVIVALTTASGLYYGFFSAYFILVGGAVGFLLHRQTRRLAQTGILLLVSFLTFCVQMLPTWLFQFHNGHDPAAFTRKVTDAETFALKFTYLVLPISHSRILLLQKLFRSYDNAFQPNVNESNLAGLGTLAAVGFLSLLVVALLKTVTNLSGRAPVDSATSIPIDSQSPSSMAWLGPLATLNLAAFLLATFAGFGEIFALLVSPTIRALDRMSICIAFFSLAAVAIGLDALIAFLRRHYRTYKRFNHMLIAGLILLALISANDQIPNSDAMPNYTFSAYLFDRDARFVKNIESAVPNGSLIFQLPCMPFTESTPPGDMSDYDLFRGYLHSSNLHWIYGSIRGRPGDLAYQKLAQLPPPQLVAALRAGGFAGIYLDRYGITDPTIESALLKAAGATESTSDDPDHRLVFIPL
jgi:phosphoglycerol transferase